MYGGGAGKVSQTVSKETGRYYSKEEAQEVLNQYMKTFSKLSKWLESNQKDISKNGYIYSHFGRKRRLANVFSEDRAVASHTARSGINFLFQSVASDITLLGAIDAQREIKRRGLKAKIFALVHDSILAEVPDEEVDEYNELVEACIQKDRGVSINGVPIGMDKEVGTDYSFGKYEKYEAYWDELQRVSK